MKVSNLIKELENYQKTHGDDEIEFLKFNEDGAECHYLQFIKLHDGYYFTGSISNSERICEFKLK